MQQETYSTGALTKAPGPKLGWRSPLLSGHRLAAVLLCGTLLLLALLPPLVSLNRYQRRVTTSMSQVLGRPVHLDRVTLNLLPLPSFTLENLVIDEAPEFGAEPMLRASTVNARLRIGSLWRHRVEFARITFTDPSVNLVHLHDGRWNLAGILLQASRVDAAPTAQTRAGNAPRFPYIEATGARINLKVEQEKMPFSLTEAEFALWLPQPQQWKMRISAKPSRTDTNVSDTGTLQIEASLERAATLGQVPLSADATWSDAPLGATSRILTGGDAGIRGQLNLSAHVGGQLSSAKVQVRAQIDSLHRADFVPEHSLFLDAECTAVAMRVFHSFADLRCSWPVPDGKGAVIAVTGSLPDVLDLRRSAQLQVGTARLPASVLTTWAHVLSSRIPPDTRATGLLSASAQYPGAEPDSWLGHGEIENLSVAGKSVGETPLPLGDLFFQKSSDSPVALSPLAIPLGGHDPAILEGSANQRGYTLHLAGMISIPRLLAFAAALPQFGEGLAESLPKNRASGPTRLDLTARRTWGSSQVWGDTVSHPVSSAPQRPSRLSLRHR